jgi:hypothetical protein
MCRSHLLFCSGRDGQIHLRQKTRRRFLASLVILCPSQRQQLLCAGDPDKAVAPFFLQLIALPRSLRRWRVSDRRTLDDTTAGTEREQSTTRGAPLKACGMCNLYSLTKGQRAIRDLAGTMRDATGNLPPFPRVFPDYAACEPSARTAGIDPKPPFVPAGPFRNFAFRPRPCAREDRGAPAR